MSGGYLVFSDSVRVRETMHAPVLSQMLPSELVDALEENLEGREVFNALPSERQRGYIQQIAGAKKTKTRLLRARRCLMSLLEKIG